MLDEEDELTGSIRYLDVGDLIELNSDLIQLYTPDEQSGVFYDEGLESAQQRPANFRYYNQTQDLLLLGAVLFTSLIQNHPFHNANKRTAFAACRMFLLLNGAQFEPPLEEAIEAAVGVAVHDYDEEQIASWISWYTRPVNCAEYLDAIQDATQALSGWGNDE